MGAFGVHRGEWRFPKSEEPGELSQLRDEELATLHHQLFRLHPVQCLGELKQQRKTIEEADMKLVRRSDGEKVRWEIIPN
jgi:hypothetical protein